MRSCGQTWLAALLLLAALLARLFWPTEAAQLRREAESVLEADRAICELAQAMGRAAFKGDLKAELIAGFWPGLREAGA